MKVGDKIRILVSFMNGVAEEVGTILEVTSINAGGWFECKASKDSKIDGNWHVYEGNVGKHFELVEPEAPIVAPTRSVDLKIRPMPERVMMASITLGILASDAAKEGRDALATHLMKAQEHLHLAVDEALK